MATVPHPSLSHFQTNNSKRFVLEAARTECERLSLPVSVCQSVCLGRVGHKDEQTYDVNIAASWGLHIWHSERLHPKPY